MTKTFRFLCKSFSFSLLLISVNGCEGWFERAAYGGFAEGQRLQLLVVNQPATYQNLHQLEGGFEYELIRQFAFDMGYKLQVKVLSHERDVQRQLARGLGDLGAARFTSPAGDRPDLLQSPVYDEDKISLVCREGINPTFAPNGQLDSNNRWRLVSKPHSIEARAARALAQEALGLKLISMDKSSKYRLKSILRGKSDCTLMDRFEAHYYLRSFPSLEIVKDISPSHFYRFLIAKNRPELVQQIRRWLTRASHRKTISQTKVLSKNPTDILTYFDIRNFLFARKKILPEYFETFKKHSRQFDIPWQLTAAVAYQESKWNPEAMSFTGVRGLMQITQETAEFLGVGDRLDAEQSIWGGAKYLKILMDRQPRGLPFKERLALALATYNVGPAHMIDAQMLAKKLNKNPYSWRDLKEVLPLLADDKYLPELKYGPARGQEPVDYVHRVFAYLELLSIQI